MMGLRSASCDYGDRLGLAVADQLEAATRALLELGGLAADYSYVHRHPSISAGHVKKPDLLRMRLVEHIDRFGGRLQQDLAALFREIGLSIRR